MDLFILSTFSKTSPKEALPEPNLLEKENKDNKNNSLKIQWCPKHQLKAIASYSYKTEEENNRLLHFYFLLFLGGGG